MLEPNIIFEDEEAIAINKPSGLMVHSDGRSVEPTLVDWINNNYPSLKDVGEKQVLQGGNEINRPGIVHRLDRDTSGVMLIAKTKEMFENLKQQFQDRLVEKEYRVIVSGVIKLDEQTIDRPIGRSAGDFRKWSAQRGAKGKLREAVTDLLVLRRLTKASYIAVFPKTGRTHQIRVHLKAIHHPVLCDKVYGFKDTICPIYIGRLALHAYKIRFADMQGVKREVVSEIPQSFENFLSDNF